MGKIVELPRAAPENKTVVVQRSNNNTDLFLDGFSFTCPNCKSINKFNAEGMIFKSVEFFCKGCGYKYRIQNPAFSNRK